jgi:putative ABC transport system permease protein
MVLIEKFATVGLPSLAGRASLAGVPLAWRNILANKQRLLRSIAGIAFAVLLMMVELGFREGFIASMLVAIRQLHGEIMLVSSTRYQFGREAPFSRRQLSQAHAVPGVASVRPLYAQRKAAVWKNPQTLGLVGVQIFAFDPDQPVFLIPEVTAKLDELRQPDTVMVDRRARSNFGDVSSGTQTELSRHAMTVIGTFRLGPDFFTDGNVVMSDRTFFRLFATGSANPADLPSPDVGVVRVLPGNQIADVQGALRAALPANVAVLTKAELMDQEARFALQVSPVGPIFDIGTLVGFAVGMLISYQILFSDLSDQLSQYATLKAMGYRNAFLVKVVLQQAVLYALLGYVPAWIICYFVFKTVGEMVLIPAGMSIGLTALSAALTLSMCIGSALIAVRRVIAADPAELF